LDASAFQPTERIGYIFPAEKDAPANHDAGDFSSPSPVVDSSARDWQPPTQFRFVNEGRQLRCVRGGVGR